MDMLIFLGTLAVVLVGGFLIIKLVIHKRSTGRRAKYNAIPVDSRLKQKHTGRPYLRHQTFARKEHSNDRWKTSRLKVNEPNWQNSSFTANQILSDADKEKESRKQEEGLAMPSIKYGSVEPARRSAGGSSKRNSG